MDLRYIAGLFDGEGSVGVYGNQRSKQGFHLRTQLCQGASKLSQQIFDELMTSFGGNLSTTISLSSKPYYNWQLNSDKAVHFLEVILPHLRLKKEQAEIAVDWQKTRPKMVRDKRGRITHKTEPNIEHDLSVVAHLKQLKQNTGAKGL